MKPEYVSQQRVEWLGLLILLSLSFNACVVIPIPRDSHPEGTRQNITQDLVDSLVPGQTTKEEVLLKLGEPDVVSKGGSRFAYHWFKIKASIFWAIGGYYGGKGDITDIRREYIFSVTFDETGLVLEKGIQEGPIDLDSFLNPKAKELLINTIEYYKVASDQNELNKIFKGKQVNVKNFTSTIAGQNKFFCSTKLVIMPPKNESFAEYIKKALIAEFNMAEGFSPQGNPSLSGHLNMIRYSQKSGLKSSMKMEGSLELSLTVTSSNGKSLFVVEEYISPCGWSVEHPARCECLTSEFMPAIQRLIGKLIRSPKFPPLLEPLNTDGGN